jgi:hypothetical protein
MRTRSIILGYVTLTLLLTAGAAQSLSGSNTVFTDDIADGNVKTSDIRANAVTSSRIAPSSVFSSDIANNAVTGDDINESTIPGFKTILTARVSSIGVLLAGEATAAARVDVANGKYKVTFARSVAGCFAVASAGDHSDVTSGHIFDNQSVATQFVPGANVNGDDNAIFVISKVETDNNAVFTDSAFTLVVVCP